MNTVCRQIEQFAATSGANVIQSSIDQALAETRTNIVWMDSNLSVIREWLHSVNTTATM
jgi:hypothetical protein